MKKTFKRLSLNRETVRHLQDVTGGIPPATYRCPSGQESCQATCMFGFCYTQSCPDVCVTG